jgi:hypothetical protein
MEALREGVSEDYARSCSDWLDMLSSTTVLEL